MVSKIILSWSDIKPIERNSNDDSINEGNIKKQKNNH